MLTYFQPLWITHTVNRIWHGRKPTFECFSCQYSSAKKCFACITAYYTIVESSCFYGFKINVSSELFWETHLVQAFVKFLRNSSRCIEWELIWGHFEYKLIDKEKVKDKESFWNRPGSSQTEHFSPWNIFFEGPFFGPFFFSPKIILLRSDQFS